MNYEQSQQLHKELVKQGIVATCLNCEHFDKEKCLLAPAFALPAVVVVFGCPKWIQAPPF